MIIKGVGTRGNDVNVIEDFSVHIPYGCCYDVDKNAVGQEPILSIIRPKSRPIGYKDGTFSISDETQCDGIFNFASIGTVTVAPGASEIDFDILGTLKKQSREAENTSLNLNFNINGSSLGSNHIGGDSFRRTYKLVKDRPFLKAGYYTSGMFGNTVYNIMLITSHHIYVAAACRFATDNYKSNEKFIDDLLNSMEPLNVKREIEEKVVIESFVMPAYKKKNKAQIGPISMMIPDGFEYVSEGHIPSGDDKVEKILSEYALVAAPKGCKGGLRNFRDASLGINLSEPQETDINSKMWKKLDDVKKTLSANIEGRKIKFVKDGKEFIVGYGKGNECPAGEEPYWVSYFIVILCGKLQYMCNLYFNSKKSTVKNYTQAVEEFCAGIDVNQANLKKAEVARVKEALGPMIAENGKLDGILASQLYSKDVIFNNDDEVSYDGKHTNMSGFQMNSMTIYDYPIILNNSKIFAQELLDLVSFVEENENLMIPKSKFHPNILKATRNNPITGATIFELCAWHMLIIAETDKNKYTVAIDNNLIKGIPDAFGFVGEFIKTLRAYNAEFSDFEVIFASTLNVDGPCGNIANPVRGAASGGMKNLKVKGDKNGKSKSYADTIAEIEDVSEEDYIASQISDLENQIADDILDALKEEAKYAKALLNKISSAIKKKKYTGLKDIDAVIERVNEAVDESTDIMAFNFSYMYRPFVNSYEMAYYARLVQSDATFQGRVMLVITENTFSSGAFKPNDFPKSLSNQMDSLTEDAIYKELLESVIYLIGEGNNVFTTLSAEYVNKQLDEWGNNFEAQETQYEGRNERIEKIHIGDQLSLKREPSNQYDSNAIDLTCKLGSVGHLPGEVAEILAPALDSGNVTAIAEVVSVTPLSQRSKREKKALLNVKIIVSETISKQKKKTNKYISATEENIKAGKTSKVSLSGMISDMKSPESFVVTDDLNALRAFIKLFKQSWINALEESNEAILAEKSTPITRSNDSRIKKLNSNTEETIRNFANKLQEVMVKIDQLGEEMKKAGAVEEDLKDICDLIAECFEELHIETTVTIYKEDKKFKHSIDSKYGNISRKWKKIYRALPSIRIQSLQQEIVDKENALEPIKKQIPIDKRKRTGIGKNIEEAETVLLQLRTAFDEETMSLANKKIQFDEDVSATTSELSMIAESLSEAEIKIAEYEKLIMEKESEYRAKISAREKDKRDKEEILRKLNGEREIISGEETAKRLRAEKAFFFKKKKSQEHEETLYRLNEKEKEISACTLEISQINEAIAILQRQKEDDIARLKSLMEPWKTKLEELKASKSSKEKTMKELESDFATSEKKHKTAEKELKEAEKKLAELKKDFEQVDKRILEAETTRNTLQDEISEIEKQIAEISIEKV